MTSKFVEFHMFVCMCAFSYVRSSSSDSSSCHGHHGSCDRPHHGLSHTSFYSQTQSHHSTSSIQATTQRLIHKYAQKYVA